MRIEGALQNSYESLSSMQRINSAADDAAGLAISQNLTAETKGYDKGTDNALSMNDLAKTADGAMSSIHDSLQRMRELAVQASNGVLTGDDRKLIQEEIDQLKQSIGGVVQNTQFNTQKLLDGTFKDKNIAMNPSGTGMKMNIQNTGLEALGIKDFDVTKDFDIKTLDNAISQVSDARSQLGATSNRIMHGVSINQISSENLTASKSRMVDLDIPKAISQMKTQEILQQYQYFAQKQAAMQKSGTLSLLG
ncbi:MAG: flagellin [Clostridia bacterium]|nr:flagellin [Clostridia bacterium]